MADMFGMKVTRLLLLLSSFGLAVRHLIFLVVLLYALMDGVMIIIVKALGIMSVNGK